VNRHELVAIGGSGLLSLWLPAQVWAQPDPLPTWNQGAARSAIADFVCRMTREGRPDFVPAAERVATFDNDGTLWAEQPISFQFAFALDEARAKGWIVDMEQDLAHGFSRWTQEGKP
jgi:hypothetical protein